MSWAALAASEPELADAGRRLLAGADGVPIAFLATSSADGRPRISPVCPIFWDNELYLSVGAHTPKVRDLLANGGYALHAFLRERDEEFQVSGQAVHITEQNERRQVHQAIQFPVFNADDPIFRLELRRCLWSRWDAASERPSQRRVWRAPPGG